MVTHMAKSPEQQPNSKPRDSKPEKSKPDTALTTEGMVSRNMHVWGVIHERDGLIHYNSLKDRLLDAGVKDPKTFGLPEEIRRAIMERLGIRYVQKTRRLAEIDADLECQLQEFSEQNPDRNISVEKIMNLITTSRPPRPRSEKDRSF